MLERFANFGERGWLGRPFLPRRPSAPVPPFVFSGLYNGSPSFAAQSAPSDTLQAMPLSGLGLELEEGDLVWVHSYYTVGSIVDSRLEFYNDAGPTNFRGLVNAYSPSTGTIEYSKSYDFGLLPTIIRANVDESLYYAEDNAGGGGSLSANPLFKIAGLNLVELGELDAVLSAGSSTGSTAVTLSEDVSANPTGLQAGDLVFLLADADSDNTTSEINVTFTNESHARGRIRNLTLDTSGPAGFKHNSALLVPVLIGTNVDASLNYQWSGTGGNLTLRPILAIRGGFDLSEMNDTLLGSSLGSSTVATVDLSSLSSLGLQAGDLLFVHAEAVNTSGTSERSVYFFNDAAGQQWRGGLYTMSRRLNQYAEIYNQTFIVEVQNDLASSLAYDWSIAPVGEGLSLRALFAIRPG